ncbi:MAG: GAF domain-containing protein, partial [Chloroflexi bacterium]|nr:GAF domain-containing protein [Chloroflexota bacterium]
DPEFRITRFNRAFERLTGKSASEVLGASLDILFPKDRREEAMAHIRRTTVGERWEVVEIPILGADGAVRTVLWNSATLYAADGTTVVATIAQGQDITERKRAEEALRRRNRELALLNQASQVFNSTLDLDQVLVTVLEEVRRLLNAVACSIWLTDPETDELVCRQGVGPHSEIVRGWCLQPGEGLAGWVIRHSESLVVPDTLADERYSEELGQQIGLTLRSILSVPLRATNGIIGVLQAMDTEVDRFSQTDLALLELLAASSAIAIDNAGLVEALRQRTVELEARNEELDAFAHTVAHDLKAPLAPLVGYAEVLMLDYATTIGPDGLRYLRRITQNGRKMGSIIDELLLLVGLRETEVQFGPLDMVSVVTEAQQRLVAMIEKHQAEIILPDTWPIVVGYGPWVEEIWANYLSNGIKYGGLPPRVELGATTQPDGKVRLWIRDNGAGLTPEEQARLFTPFRRLDQVHTRGHGLGLSIVRRIVEKMGGQVGVESEVGEGSVFTFTLPGALNVQRQVSE